MKSQGFGLNKRGLLVATVGLLAIVLSAVVFAHTTSATPSDGVSGTPIASGQLQEPISTSLLPVIAESGAGEDQASHEEQGESHASDSVDVAQISVVKYEVEPGGVFGWHQHGGPIWVVITSGELTLYDEDCATVRQSAGSAFLDSGSHLHNARNEGDEAVEIYATFMLPEDGDPRIDLAEPSGCGL